MLKKLFIISLFIGITNINCADNSRYSQMGMANYRNMPSNLCAPCPSFLIKITNNKSQPMHLKFETMIGTYKYLEILIESKQAKEIDINQVITKIQTTKKYDELRLRITRKVIGKVKTVIYDPNIREIILNGK